jgi:glycosyltransferase involved in cell wall biosynthesis
MVANFHPVKGHAELIRALALISREGGGHHAGSGSHGSGSSFDPRTARLMFVGAGKTMEAARQLAEREGVADRVLFVGRRHDVADLLRASDVFVLNSFSEGMSNALLEALAAGLACVATDVGGNPELVHPGDNGLLVPPGRPEPLAHALRRLLADGALRGRMGRRSRERAESEYGLDAMVRKTEEVYEAVLRDRVR